MQAALILAFFSILMGIMASFIAGAGPGPAQLKESLEQDTLRYLEGIKQVVHNELTPSQFQAMPSTMTAAQFVSQSAIVQLAPGQWGDPTYDAWGNPMRFPTNFIRQNVALSSQAVAPVTGFVFISAGKDRVFQTNLPSPLTTLSALQGITPPTGSDDLVVAFTDEDAQRANLNFLQVRMDRIANALLADYQKRVAAYRSEIEANYRIALQTSSTMAPPDLEDMILNDPAAPQFLDVSTPAGQQALGVTEEFATLERSLPQGGRLQVTMTPLNGSLREGAILQLTNYSPSPSPWPTLELTITLRGGLNQ